MVAQLWRQAWQSVPVLQVGVARSYVEAQPAAAAADVSVELVDWLDGGSTSPCDGTFDVGYDYTCAPPLLSPLNRSISATRSTGRT